MASPKIFFATVKKSIQKIISLLIKAILSYGKDTVDSKIGLHYLDSVSPNPLNTNSGLLCLNGMKLPPKTMPAVDAQKTNLQTITYKKRVNKILLNDSNVNLIEMVETLKMSGELVKRILYEH